MKHQPGRSLADTVPGPGPARMTPPNFKLKSESAALTRSPACQ
jgi:hypothetical protein